MLFKEMPSLRRVSLVSNALGPQAGLLVAKALKDGLQLSHLDLSSQAANSMANKFHSVVGVAFAQALTCNTTLQHLALSGTSLGLTPSGKIDLRREAALCLGEALRASQSLRSLRYPPLDLHTFHISCMHR